jgi:2-phospho-L-lactate guanylyltransferase
VKTAAIVPVKSLVRAKSRLAGALDPQERVTVTLGMLWHVLETIAQSGMVDMVGVISPDPDLPTLPHGAIHIEQPEPGLNWGLEQGREWAIAQGAEAVLVVFADLPLLSATEIAEILSLGRDNGTVVLAPDRHGTGTNVMLAHPPSLARLAFGRNSFNKHLTLHEEAGALIKTYSSTGTALDVDTPDDLTELERLGLVLEGL